MAPVPTVCIYEADDMCHCRVMSGEAGAERRLRHSPWLSAPGWCDASGLGVQSRPLHSWGPQDTHSQHPYECHPYECHPRATEREEPTYPGSQQELVTRHSPSHLPVRLLGSSRPAEPAAWDREQSQEKKRCCQGPRAGTRCCYRATSF